jgi:hypothetical protein
MTLIAGDLITAGIGTSARNRANILADSQGELLGVLNRLVMDLFLDASVLNPFFVGTVETVEYSTPGGGWPRPTRALSIIRLEAISGGTVPSLYDGTEIIVIQPDNREAGAFEPSVMELGGVFVPSPIANTDSPTSGTLRMYYARRPVLLGVTGAVTQTIDPLIPDDMEAYFVAGIAAYLAMKDQRPDEVAVQSQSRDAMRTSWAQMVGAATPAVRRTWQPRSALNTATEPTQ